MSNPVAALFEDVEATSDPMLAEVDLSDSPFAPLAPPAPSARSVQPSARQPSAPQPSAPIGRNGASSPPPQNAPMSAVHEMLSPPPGLGSGRRKSIQQALVVTWDQDTLPDLLELNDLLASGWRVATTAPFPTVDGTRGSLLVVVEQEMPR